MTSVSGEFGLTKQKLSIPLFPDSSVTPEEVAAIASSALAICKGTFGDQWVVADYDALAAADVLWYPPALKSSTHGGVTPLITASLPGYVKKGSAMWESNNQGKGARFYYITRIISNPEPGTFISPDNMTGTDVNPINTPVASVACAVCHPRDKNCHAVCPPVPTYLSRIRLEAHHGAKRVFCSGPNVGYTTAPSQAPTASTGAPTAAPTIAPTRSLGGIVAVPNGTLSLSESGEDIVEVRSSFLLFAPLFFCLLLYSSFLLFAPLFTRFFASSVQVLSVVPAMIDTVMTSTGATTVTASCASDDVTVLAPASITIRKGDTKAATIKAKGKDDYSNEIPLRSGTVECSVSTPGGVTQDFVVRVEITGRMQPSYRLMCLLRDGENPNSNALPVCAETLTTMGNASVVIIGGDCATCSQPPFHDNTTVRVGGVSLKTSLVPGSDGTRLLVQMAEFEDLPPGGRRRLSGLLSWYVVSPLRRRVALCGAHFPIQRGTHDVYAPAPLLLRCLSAARRYYDLVIETPASAGTGSAGSVAVGPNAPMTGGQLTCAILGLCPLIPPPQSGAFYTTTCAGWLDPSTDPRWDESDSATLFAYVAHCFLCNEAASAPLPTPRGRSLTHHDASPRRGGHYSFVCILLFAHSFVCLPSPPSTDGCFRAAQVRCETQLPRVSARVPLPGRQSLPRPAWLLPHRRGPQDSVGAAAVPQRHNRCGAPLRLRRRVPPRLRKRALRDVQRRLLRSERRHLREVPVGQRVDDGRHRHCDRFRGHRDCCLRTRRGRPALVRAQHRQRRAA
jgi:hypothetical protein